MREKFSDQQQATLFDSDPKKLQFVFRDIPTGNEISILSTDTVSNTDPRLGDLGNNFALLTTPYEVRQRNKVNFQIAFQTPPNTDVVTSGIVPTSVDDPVGVETVIDFTQLTPSALNVIDLTAYNLVNTTGTSVDDTLRRLRAFKIEVLTPFDGPGLTTMLCEPFLVDPPVVKDLIHRSPPPAFGGTFQYECGVVHPEAPYTELALLIPAFGQELHLDFVSNITLNTLTAGSLKITVFYSDVSFFNHKRLSYLDFQALSGRTNFINISVPALPGGPDVRLAQCRAYFEQPFGFGSSGTELHMQVGIASFTTNVIDTIAGDGVFLPDDNTIADTGPINLDFTGNVFGVQLGSVAGPDLSTLTQGLVVVEFFWTVDTHVSTPFTWTGSELGFQIWGSVDNKQYNRVLGLFTQNNAPDIVDMLCKVDVPSALHYIPDSAHGFATGPWIDNVNFTNSLSLSPVRGIDTLVQSRVALILDPPPYNYYRVQVLRNATEGGSNDDPVTFSITPIAREV